jgi:aspartyl-tRNA synthetase
MKSIYRSHTCGDLAESSVGETATLSGWVHRKRDHGNLLFIDLRDHYGLTQCVIETGAEQFSILERVRPESVIKVTGPVVARSADSVNTALPTGHVELRIEAVEVLSSAEELPLQVFGDQLYPEDTRLRYRFLDLRREQLHNNVMLRSRVFSGIRRLMGDQGFTEFQTPILTASSPEGARDFLVPSRLHPGQFYALPQAPQQFKQLVMVAGFDRYFQIAPCFRDEDPRADRSPGEFYQLDLEMSFVEQDDVFAAVEPVVHGIFSEHGSWQVDDVPFRRIPHSEAMLKYGSDKPDLRNPILIADVTEGFRGSGFKIFAGAIEKGSVVRAIPAPGAAKQPRSFFDKMNDWARKEQGAAGLGYIVFDNGEAKGPIAKNLDPSRINKIRELTGVSDGDAVFFSCDKPKGAATLAGAARICLGEDLALLEAGVFRFCWITDFPLYEYDEDAKKIEFGHNPFSMPQGGLEALDAEDPLTILSQQYDLVCNGNELASGAIRNHRPEVMVRAFAIAGYDEKEVKERFGGLYSAFHFGAPPHGGMAFGMERIVMLLADETNLREVTLFPMNQRAEDLMMGAPSEPTPAHLRELSVRVVLPEPKKDETP